MKTKTLNQISQEKYGKDYNHLPDDGAEQDFVQGEYSRLNQVKPVCNDLSEQPDKAAPMATEELANKLFNISKSFYHEQYMQQAISLIDQFKDDCRASSKAVNEHAALMAVAKELETFVRVFGDYPPDTSMGIRIRKARATLAALASVRQ